MKNYKKNKKLSILLLGMLVFPKIQGSIGDWLTNNAGGIGVGVAAAALCAYVIHKNMQHSDPNGDKETIKRIEFAGPIQKITLSAPVTLNILCDARGENALVIRAPRKNIDTLTHDYDHSTQSLTLGTNGDPASFTRVTHSLFGSTIVTSGSNIIYWLYLSRPEMLHTILHHGGGTLNGTAEIGSLGENFTLTSTDGVTINLDAVRGNLVHIRASNGSDVNLGAALGDLVSIKAYDGSDVTVAGKVKSVEVDLHDGCSCDLRGLQYTGSFKKKKTTSTSLTPPTKVSR